METTNNIYDHEKVYEYKKTHEKPTILGFMDLWYHTDELILKGRDLKEEIITEVDLGLAKVTVECTYQDNDKTVIYTEMYLNDELSMVGTDTIIHYNTINELANKQCDVTHRVNEIINAMRDKGFFLVDDELIYDEYGLEYDEEGKKLHIYNFECFIPSDKTIAEAYDKIHNEEDSDFFEKNNILRWGLKTSRDGLILKTKYYYIIGEEYL